jgi:hypothetical protein
MTRSFAPRDDPDIDSVWRWFEYQLTLTQEDRERVLRIIAPGSDFHASAVRAHDAPFIFLTRKDVDEFFDNQIGQLELLTMFEMLATAEATLRIAFKTRVKQRRKDALSRRFRASYKRHGEKIRLDEDILAALKEEGFKVGAFRGTLKLRDWLAHGRHWHPKLGRGYTPGDVLGIAREIIDSIPA